MENAQDYIDLLFSQPGAPDPPDSDITREGMIALIEANMEKYGITNSYMKNAMMGIILSEGGFKGVAENMNYTTPGRLAEVWSTFSTYKNSKGQTIRAPKGQGSKYANELAKSGKYVKNPEALGNFIYGNRMNNDQPGDGYKYRGRGLNQLTGKGAYKSLGDKLGFDLVSNPDLLIQNPELQAEVAVKFLADRINTTLPRLVKKYSKYAKRFPNLDYNNYTNQEDASYLLTSANAGFGKTLKSETIDKRLAEAKKFNYHLNDRPDEELTANAVSPAEEEINSVVNTQKEEEEIVAPFDQWDEQESVYDTENVEKVQVPFDQEDIKYSPDNYENTIANANAETAPVNNLDAGEQERQKKFNLNLFKSLKLPQIHRGQSLFGQGNLFGANNKKRTGGSLNSRYFKNGGPGDGEDEIYDPMRFMVDAKTNNIKTYNFDSGEYDVSGTPYKGNTTGMMSHVSDRYASDDTTVGAELARIKKAEDLAKWSATRTKGAQNQIADRSIRNLGRTIEEQGSSYKDFLWDINGAECITGSSCNLSPTPGDPTEPTEENLARVPFHIKDKKGNWIPNTATKSGKQKVGVSPSSAEQKSALKGGVPGGPIPGITGNQSFASKWDSYGMEMMPQSVLPKPGDIQVMHGFEEKEWASRDPSNIQRGNKDTGYWRRKRKADGSPVYTNGKFVYGMAGNSNHAQTVGPAMTDEIKKQIWDSGHSRNDDLDNSTNFGEYNAEVKNEEPLALTNNWGSGNYSFVMPINKNKPTDKGTATMRYTGANSMYQDILKDRETRFPQSLKSYNSAKISKLPLTSPGLLSTPKLGKELPSVLLNRTNKMMSDRANRGYATGGSLDSPCSNGQIFDTKSGKCVSYEAWEKNNSGFNMNDVKKENEDYFKANEWFKNYHNSPKYYEMTRGSYPEGIIGDVAAGILRARRKQNLKTIPPLQILPQEDPNTGGGSYSDTGQIEIYPNGFGVGTGTHEVSHSTDRPIYGTDQGQRMIPASDTKYANKRKADVLGDSREYFNNKDYYNWLAANKPKEFKKQEKDFLDFSNYVAENTETRARLNTIRQMAQEQGMYDPFTQKVSSNLYYKKLKKLQLKTKDRKKKGYNPMKQLQDTYSDEEIIWMLNNISKNETIKNNNDTGGMA